jgi:hypothetical protein
METAAPRFDGLMIFRAVLAAWILIGPWLFGTGFDASGISDWAVGLAILTVALGAGKQPGLRWLQAAAGLWMIFSAVVLDPQSEFQRYDEILLGKLLLFSAPVTRELFT